MKHWLYILAAALFVLASCQHPSSDYGSFAGDAFDLDEKAPDSVVLAAFAYYDSVVPGKGGSRYNKELLFQKAKSFFFKAAIEAFKQRKSIPQVLGQDHRSLSTHETLGCGVLLPVCLGHQ